MENISTLLKKEKNEIKYNRLFLEISPESFKNLVDVYFENMENKKFEIDENNKNVYNQLYFYLTGDKQFKGDLNKGIILTGGYGTGKTTAVRIFAAIYSYLGNYLFKFVSALELVEIVKIESIDKNLLSLEKTPLIIDEIGRENTKVLVYGTERLPMPELLTLRYNSKAFTIGTSNLTKEQMISFYGNYIGDRLIDMFNFIELLGKSKRIWKNY